MGLESGMDAQNESAVEDTSRQPRRSRRAGSDRFMRGSRWASRILLLLAAAMAVLWQGGASVEAMFGITAVTGLAWLAALPTMPHKSPRSRMAWLWIALGLWTALQLVPLPHAVVALLRPQTAAIVDAGRDALGLPRPTWLPLALATGDAALQGALYLVAGAISALAGLVLMGDDSRSVARNTSLFVLVLCLASGLAWLLGWFGPVSAMLPGSLANAVRGLCLVNPNHEAGLLNVGLALALGRVAQGGSNRQQTLFGILATFLAVMVLFVGSRGGYLTLCAVLAMTVFSLPRPPKYLRRDERDKQLSALRRVGSIALVVLVLGALLALPLLEKELQPTSLHDEKLMLIGHMAQLIRGAWLTGLGPGALPVIAGMDPTFGIFRHDFAENLLLERALDDGLPLAIAFTVALVLLVRRMVRRWDGVTAVPGMIVAVAALLMANLVDFSVEVAGGLVPMLLLAACAERLLPDPALDGERSAQKRRSRLRVLAGTGAAVAIALWLLTIAAGSVTRRVPAALAGKPPAVARQLVADHFVHDQHAFYLLGRILLDSGDLKAGLRALDRAVTLRPDSKHAHLFRFATRVELGLTAGAVADLRWLLKSDRETFQRTLQLCARSSKGEAVLLSAIPDLTEESYAIGVEYERTRADLLERLALTLREKYPTKRFGIEAVRGHLYVKRGMMEPARQIATAMLVDPQTRDQGWMLEALIQAHTGHPMEAFHLFADLCNRRSSDVEACHNAVESGLSAKQARPVLRFLEKHRLAMMETPGRAAMYWYGVAAARMMLNEFDEAVQAARTAHGLLPDDVNTALLLGNALGQVGQHEEARELVSHLRESHPQDGRVLKLWKEVEVELSPMAGLVHERPAVLPPGPPSPTAQAL